MEYGATDVLSDGAGEAGREVRGADSSDKCSRFRLLPCEICDACDAVICVGASPGVSAGQPLYGIILVGPNGGCIACQGETRRE